MYEGDWQDNKPHGLGTEIRADGETKSGLWEQGAIIRLD